MSLPETSTQTLQPGSTTTVYRAPRWGEVQCVSTTRTRWALAQGSEIVAVQFSAPDTVGVGPQVLPTSVRFQLFPGATVLAEVFAADTTVAVIPVVLATWHPWMEVTND